ncbi:hypothetical protein D3C72_2224530 [compost metagenome]
MLTCCLNQFNIFKAAGFGENNQICEALSTQQRFIILILYVNQLIFWHNIRSGLIPVVRVGMGDNNSIYSKQ